MSAPMSAGQPMGAVPKHGVLRAVGAGVTGVIVLASAGSLVPEMSQRTELQDLGWQPGSTTLRVSGSQGDIEIKEAAPGEDPSIQVEKTWAFTDPTVTTSFKDGVASVGVTCDFRPFARCNADWTIVVPEGTAVEVNADVGDVRLEALTGAVKVEGEVGDVRFEGAPSSLDIATSVGDVRAELSSPSTSVRVRSNVGDVNLRLPGDISYDVHARSDLPGIVNAVPVNSASPYDVDVSTNVGEIQILPND